MSQPEIFVIRNGHEEGVFVLDEDTGLFVGETTFGTFSHIWPPSYRSQPLKEFVATAWFDYFAGKTFKGKLDVFDHDATINAAKIAIIECRRSRDISQYDAREVWNEILDVDGYNEQSFLDGIQDLPGLDDVLGSDWYEIVKKQQNPQVTAFKEILWPLLKVKLCENQPENQPVEP